MVFVARELELVDAPSRADQGHAAAGDDALFDRGLSGGLGVFEQGLAFLHFGLGRGADVDLGDAAGELGQPLLQLLAVVLAVGVVDLAADLLGAALDLDLLAGAVDDRRVLARRW